MSQETKSESFDVAVQRLAGVYASALLEAADAAGQTATVTEEFDALLGLLDAQPQLEQLLTGALGRTARAATIEKAFAGRASDELLRFLLVLNDHERLDLLRPIRQAVHDQYNDRQNRVKVDVFSAVPLAEDQQHQVAEGVRQRFHLEPILQMHVDPALLGGLKVRVGDVQVDATVRTRLDKLRNQIIARSSYEIQSRRDRFRTQ